MRHFVVVLLLSLAAATIAKPNPGTETPHTRKYFYTGGQYVDDGTGNHIWTDQLYVEELTPLGGASKKDPIVFIHGQAQTGTNWLNKPDGSPGWSSFFLSHGYRLYIVDQTYRGRSPTPTNLTTGTYSAELVQLHFTVPELYDVWPQSQLHTQWPGKGVQGDEYFDTYYSSTVPFLSGSNAAAIQQTSFQHAAAKLLDRIGKPSVLVAHSQAGAMPWLLADVRPGLVKSIVGLEPLGPPFREAVFSTNPARAYGVTDAPLTYDPPVTDPATDLVQEVMLGDASAGVADCVLQASNSTRKLANLQNIPTVVVTSEASYHATYDWCTARFLQQAGVPAEHLPLASVGVHGNGHMMFLEKNSDVVAGKVKEWIERH
ncbi:Alpha/Beta hydrolase protein [Fomes fomentarius]|nr:Alpha/Beta hydrolase protein [Fomes fomentarius]